MSYLKKLKFIGKLELEILSTDCLDLISQFIQTQELKVADSAIYKDSWHYKDLEGFLDLTELYKDTRSEFWLGISWDKVEFKVFIENNEIFATLSLFEWFKGLSGFAFSPARHYKLWEVKLKGITIVNLRPFWSQIDNEFDKRCAEIYWKEKDLEYRKRINEIGERLLSEQ